MQITNFIFFQKANYIFPSFFTDFFCFSDFTFEKKIIIKKLYNNHYYIIYIISIIKYDGNRV